MYYLNFLKNDQPCSIENIDYVEIQMCNEVQPTLTQIKLYKI